MAAGWRSSVSAGARRSWPAATSCRSWLGSPGLAGGAAGAKLLDLGRQAAFAEQAQERFAAVRVVAADEAGQIRKEVRQRVVGLPHR